MDVQAINTATRRKVWIQTFGCQMNENDTEKMYRILSKLDYIPTNTFEDADLILLNTCSIREKPEQKVFSSLGRIRKRKQMNPEVMIGVAGCMAQLMGEKITERAPYVDLVLGTYNIHKLPEMIAEVTEKRRLGEMSQSVRAGKMVAEDFDFLPIAADDLHRQTSDANNVTRHVTIQNGCNKNCSYCIVPTVRGRELSREADEIISEIKLLVASGVKEVMLVGQTVNSYGKGTATPFPKLLELVDNISGLERIRFVTSHPRDLNRELMRAMADLPKVCESLHLPLQSGSDRVLRQMYRGYTVEKYIEKVAALRETVPNIALSSDVIVAFPGETEDEFAMTLKALERICFDSVYSFVYSPRPFTVAGAMENQIAAEIGKERLQRLQTLQNQITSRYLHNELNQTHEVLVEAAASNHFANTGKPGRALRGRTRTNRIVHFDGSRDLVGQLVNVKIDRICSHSLQGVLV